MGPRGENGGPERVDASVLIPVLNEERYIRDTVAAMQAQRFDGSVEFLFMDGRSADRTKAILEELSTADSRIRVFDNPGRSSTAGLNVGLRNARGEYIVRMDAHTFYPEDYIARGVERLRRGDVVWVAGPQVPYGTGRWSRRVALALGSWFGTGGSARWGADANGGGERELDTGVFAGLWHRATVEEHGGWDEGWPINQDSELAARVLRAGGRIVSLPELGARYVPRDSLSGLARQYWRYGNYRAKTASRHPESLDPRHLFAPGVALAVVGSVVAPRPLRTVARAGVAAYAAAVVAASASALREAEPADAAALPLVFGVMHGAWGFGYLAGSVRFGPPFAALARIARR
ncbi:MAG: succinoglycan biosynthesis protein ExoA [Thermoleophilaceae bacterium]|jgi:glycosyltransferase involved in cell wall biosynthesis|nr:succinoglycan biosynthesis protein ExoA [Thermoleophilaceae bacterium]MEA2353755.1 succinoglycan biosynthesis protein ExoA [Thermoleophilaceae bacterium]MEA2387764.1 succinoglycan biosynthesis protein ExoA [Thermoleophilaceae bacterium]